MVIIKTSQYKHSYKKEIINKHLLKEKERLENIENFLLSKANLQDVMLDLLRNIYYIEKKKGNLKQYYTARINSKMRLLIKPNGKYPYDIVEIEELIFESIDDTHYGEG